jgi:hypothetical protein
MKIFLIFVYFIAGITSIAHDRIELTPPQIVQEFTCKIHVDMRVMLTHYILNGQLSLDKLTNSLAINVYGNDPYNYWGKLNLTLVMSQNSSQYLRSLDPKNQENDISHSDVKPQPHKHCVRNLATNLTVWGVRNGKCMSLPQLDPNQIPPLSIPSDAIYKGKRMVDNKNCDIWRINKPYISMPYLDVIVFNRIDQQFAVVEAIEALYYTEDKYAVYINAKLFDIDEGMPNPEVFREPKECMQAIFKLNT